MSDRRDYKVIAVDFDGTLFETDYPRIVRPILPVIEMAKKRREADDKLILWTCREGAELDSAVEACRAFGLEFDAVNDNLPEAKAEWGNNPRKVAADEYWDDRNCRIYLEEVVDHGKPAGRLCIFYPPVNNEGNDDES